jgi:X-Pro dipeptidyl-peptidase
MRLPLAVLSAAVAAGLTATVAGAAPAHAADPPSGIVVKDGLTQPVFPFADAITENVYVETRVDSDSDGRRDRVHLKITRPAAGFKVASIIEPSPYFAGILDEPNHGVDIEEMPENVRRGLAATGGRVGPPGLYLRPTATMATEDYYVTRGYAFIRAESIGSGESEGCPTTGDQRETLGMRAVVDWLGGRAKGYTEAGAPAAATWSDTTAGMMGASYNGTLPNQVATTGVAGLKTIVPIAAISSWYDYYRANGLVVAPGGYQGEDADVLARAVLTRKNPDVCASLMNQIEAEQDRVTGDFSPFWRARDYVDDADKVKASVFITHGQEDWNVKTTHFAQWWDALGKAGVDRKLWLHPKGHGGSGAAWRLAVHRWLDHELYGVQNGIDAEKIASVERLNGTVESYANWPDPAVRKQVLKLSPGQLGPKVSPVTESFIDSGATIKVPDLAAKPTTASPNRLAYLGAALKDGTRLSGTPRVKLRATVVNKRAANLSAALVDYNADGTVAKIVSRGWIDVQNRNTKYKTEPITPGELYTFAFNMEPKDYVFEAGHRIGLLILSTDYDFTLRPKPGTEIAVALGASSLELPLVP